MLAVAVNALTPGITSTTTSSSSSQFFSRVKWFYNLYVNQFFGWEITAVIVPHFVLHLREWQWRALEAGDFKLTFILKIVLNWVHLGFTSFPI